MLKIKLKDAYPNPFMTLMNGFAIKKDEVKEVDENIKEVRMMIEQGTFIVVDGESDIEVKEPKGLTSEKIFGEKIKKEESKNEDLPKKKEKYKSNDGE